MRSESDWHREVYRHWGEYDFIYGVQRSKFTRITLKFGAKLIVQFFHHQLGCRFRSQGLEKKTMALKRF